MATSRHLRKNEVRLSIYSINPNALTVSGYFQLKGFFEFFLVRRLQQTSMTIYYSWTKNPRVSTCSGFVSKTRNAMRFPLLFAQAIKDSWLITLCLQQVKWSLAVLQELVLSVPILSKPDNQKTFYICIDLACHLSEKKTWWLSGSHLFKDPFELFHLSGALKSQRTDNYKQLSYHM